MTAWRGYWLSQVRGCLEENHLTVPAIAMELYLLVSALCVVVVGAWW